MQRYEVTYFQMVMIGLAVGFVLGLIPLALGFYKGKKKLAIIGFLASIAAGAAWSIFSLIIVLVFVWLILRSPNQQVEQAGAQAELEASDSEFQAEESGQTTDENA